MHLSYLLLSKQKRQFDDLLQQQQPSSPHHKFSEEIYRRARLRETELLEIIKMLKNEVNSMRKRFSLIKHERSSSSSRLANNSGSFMTPFKGSGAGQYSGNTPTTVNHQRMSQQLQNQHPSSSDFSEVSAQDVEEDGEDDNEGFRQDREARMLYLRQAFSGFFRAKNAVEMQHLGRVICAILGVDIEEQAVIMDSIMKLSPAVVATTTIESITQQLASIFN